MNNFYKIFIVVIILFSTDSFGHKEWVHQHIVYEAYRLLSLYYNMPVSEIQNNLGSYGAGTGPWVHGEILKGAYREDLEDPVTGAGAWWTGWDAASTHFWQVDNNDFGNNPVDYLWTYPAINAYHKAYKYINGGWRLKKQNYIYKYNSLVDLYVNGNLHWVGYIDEAGIEYSRDEWFVASTELRRIIVWEILGRVCHLLADMSIPAHVHLDDHVCWAGDPDNYEDDIAGAGNGILNCTEQVFFPGPYTNYTAESAFNSGNFVDAYTFDEANPIRYLFYYNAQVSDHFASQDRGGDNDLGNNPYPGMQDYINSLGPAHPQGQVNVTQNANIMMNLAIRSTASLLYWFAKEANLLKAITVATNRTEDFVQVRNPALSIDPNSQYYWKVTPYTLKFDNSITIDLMADPWANGYAFINWEKRNKNNVKIGGYSGGLEWLNANATATSTFVANYQPLVTVSFYQIRIESPNANAYYKNQTTGEISSSFTFPQGYPITVEAVAPQDYLFLGWSNGNGFMGGPNPASFNPTSSISGYYATFKKMSASNNSGAYNTNGQRKAVKTSQYYSPLYNVYESLGNVWLEASTDNGQSWRIENNGQPISGGAGGRCPSITADQSGYSVAITFQELISNSTSSKIKIISYYNLTQQINLIGEFVISNSSAINLNPITSLGNDLTIVTTYEQSGTINCLFGFWHEAGYPLIGADWSISTYQLFGNNYSGSSQVSGISGSTTYYHLTATKNITYEKSDIVYKKFRIQRAYEEEGSYPPYCNGPDPNDPNCAWPVEEIIESNVSAGSGGSLMNIRPTISLANNYPVVSWITGYYAGPNEITSSRVLTRRGPTWGSTYQCGYQTKYVNNNSASTTTEKTVIVYSEGNPAIVSKWIKRTGTSYIAPQNLSHSGIQTQVLSSSDYQYMTAMVFNNSALPYYFIKSTTNFSYTPPQDGGGGLTKITDTDTILTYGRSGIANVNGIEFVFNIGDILVGDSIINFIEIPDTLLYSSAEDLNQSTRTEDFHLNSNTLFLFTNFYEVVQKANPDTSLSQTDAVNFKAELVNSATGNIVGTFDNITYNKNNLAKYASIDYEVDCSGVTPGNYYLRLVTTVSGEAAYSLANVVNDNTTLAKKNYNRVNIEGSEIPITYALEQNYPNPFNPTTTIRYQIPKEGIVTLKVYDILGAEVVTLVNEEKIAGKYEVNFNASNLASGVYIYRIKANDFISTKKMVFLK